MASARPLPERRVDRRWEIDVSFDSIETAEPHLGPEDARWLTLTNPERPQTRAVEDLYCGDNLSLGVLQSGGYEFAHTVEDYVILLVPLSGRVSVTKSNGDFPGRPGRFILHGPGRARLRTAGENGQDFRAISFAFSQAMVQEWADILLPGHALTVTRAVDALRGDGSLISLQADLQWIADLDETIARRARETIAATLTDKVLGLRQSLHEEAGAAPEGSASAAQVRRAEDVLMARSNQPLTIAQLAREAGTGLRSLQIAFMRLRGYSPKAALTRMRLERAHDAIMRADPGASITDIALSNGFWHLGRFSKAYQARFGATPSENLRNSQRLVCRPRVSPRRRVPVPDEAIRILDSARARAD